MAKSPDHTVIKKYANRRLYNTGTSTYVTLEDLAAMVKREEDFVVYDAKTGEDITRSVLTQIIFEQENKGQNLLPITFLRQLIRFYDDSMHQLVPSYLEYSMSALTRDQERLRQQMTDAFGVSAFSAIEDQVRTNMAMFDKAMRMFAPFPRGEGEPGESGEPTRRQTDSDSAGELDQLRRQMSEMQRQLDRLVGSDQEKTPGKTKDPTGRD